MPSEFVMHDVHQVPSQGVQTGETGLALHSATFQVPDGVPPHKPRVSLVSPLFGQLMLLPEH